MENVDTPAIGTVAPGEDRIEIRLLGPLRVRRADGTAVDHAAWRTSKTVDLLRLLAVQVGQPVPVSRIIDCLWPDVPEHRGRASLRTAASTIRHVLGAGCMERRLGGLVLREAWVDTVAFTALARETRSYERENMPSRVVAAAREAEALYLEDFRADDDTGSWATHERAALQETYRRVLEDAADAALSLGWHRDAAAFATRAIARDACAERPVRTLMAACAALGQVEQALRAFQRCRRALAEELGVDPSPQTDQLHVRVLTGEIASVLPARPPFTGRHTQLQQVIGALAEASTRTLPTVVELRGDDGCGRRRLLDEACAHAGTTWQHVDDLAAPLAPGVVRFASSDVLARLTQAPGALADRDSLTARGLTITTGDTSDVLRDHVVGRGWTWHRVTVPRLTHDEVGDLVGSLCGGTVSPSLVDEVASQAAGNLARVVSTARAHLRSGRIRSTNDGLTLVPDDAVQDVDAQAVLARALEQLPPEAHEAMQAVALVESPIDLDALLPALSGDPERGSARRALDQLVDLELLTTGPSGYHFRHRLVASAVQAWLRPSARRALHSRIAERAVLPAAERIDHWLKAGEPQLACAAAIDASTAALASDRHAEARECLLRARHLSSLLGTDPADQAELGEQLGDVCARLGRYDEAADVYAFTLREAAGLPAARRQRVLEKQAAAERGRAVADLVLPAVRTSVTRSWTLKELGEQLGVPADAVPSTQVEELLRTALLEATASSPSHDAADRSAGIRILLVSRVLLPRRQLSRAKETLEPIASLTTRTDLLGRAAVARWLPDILLGDARAALAPLEAAIASVDDHDAAARLRKLALLARHDLGRSSGQPDADDPARPWAGPWWRWLMTRTLAEAGRLDEAEAWRSDAASPRTPMLRQLEALASAELHEASGRRDAAMAVLRAAADDAVESGCTLLLPEAAARLVILECGVDEGRAQDDFDMMDWALAGEAAHPRETYFRLLARAHVRAQQGELERAAVAASAAQTVAAEHGLTVLGRRAEGVRQSFSEMHHRHRAGDVSGESGHPAPPGCPERRLQFAALVRAGVVPSQRAATDLRVSRTSTTTGR